MLLTEAPLNHKVNRERMTQTMFETINLPAMQATIPDVLSLYTQAASLVLPLTWAMTCCTPYPFYEDYALPHANLRLDLAGRDHHNG